MYYRSSIHGLTQTILFLLRFFFRRTQCNNTRVAAAAQGRSQGSKGRGCEVTICRQPTGLC